MPDVIVHGELIEDLLQLNQEATLRMFGTSMLPLLPEGSMVGVSRSLGRIETGDIVCFRLKDIVIAHRLVGISKADGRTFAITKGDNSASLDPLLETCRILGKVVSVNGRKITGPAWRIRHYLIAKVSRLEGNLPEWREHSPLYKKLYRLKKKIKWKSPLYPLLCGMTSFCFRFVKRML